MPVGLPGPARLLWAVGSVWSGPGYRNDLGKAMVEQESGCIVQAVNVFLLWTEPRSLPAISQDPSDLAVWGLRPSPLHLCEWLPFILRGREWDGLGASPPVWGMSGGRLHLGRPSTPLVPTAGI